jgi:anaerobic ribonucleoside-triphosphate reductase activating protein
MFEAREVSGPVVHVAMRIADTDAEGPGRRYALWVQGCSLRCAGCCNPEMLPTEGGERMLVSRLAEELNAHVLKGIEGISLLGGEPFEQAEGLAELAAQARALGLSVMVYSGYTRAELEAREDAATRRLLALTDVLVDGRYVASERDEARRWVGSRNQVVHHLTDRYAQDARFGAANEIEIRLEHGQVLVNGWPVPATRLVQELRRKRTRDV